MVCLCMNGYACEYMGMYGYIWVCMGIYGYIWVCMGILYLLDVFINFNYVIVTIVRWSLRCQNDYPLGLGSLNPDPSACTV